MMPLLSGKRERYILYLTFVSLAVLILSLYSWSSYYRSIYQIQKFAMDVYIKNELGFDVGSDAIHFGYVPPGGKAMKNVNITVDDVRTLVTIESEGNISGFMRLSDNDFILEPYETRKVEVSAVIPKSTQLNKYYNGTLMVILRKI